MNILHLSDSIGRKSGGLGPTLIGLNCEYRAMNHRATVWSLDSSAELVWVAQATGIDRKNFATFPVLGPAHIGFSPAMERAAISAEGQQFDLLHQISIWTGISRVTKCWRGKSQKPTVVSVAGTLEEYALKRSAWKKRLATWAYEWRNLTAASCLHATATSEVQSIRNFGLRNPVALIPAGVPATWLASVGDPQRFRQKFDLPVGKRILFFLSRIHPKKGLDLLFEAMAIIKPQLENTLLVVAGTDDHGYSNSLKALARHLQIDDSIRFVGPLFGADKRDAFAAADIFVLPTHSENFGIVVPEALGAGVPVLTTRGTPWENLVHQKCGWWVDVEVGALREALLDSMHLPKDELGRMGERGKRLVQEQYTWRIAAERYVILYEWLLGHGERPAFVIVE